VYGVITDALSGFSNNLTPPQVYNNRAIAMNVVASDIGASPGVVVAYASGGTRGLTAGDGGAAGDSYSAGSGSPACLTAWKHFDVAYTEWIQAHGLLESLAQYAARPADLLRLQQVRPAAARVPLVENATLARMRDAVTAMNAARAPDIAATGARVVDVAAEIATVDEQVAGSAELSAGLAALEAGDARIVPVAAWMDNVYGLR
jgi:hypothetical protein